jgi:hypothetical protein
MKNFLQRLILPVKLAILFIMPPLFTVVTCVVTSATLSVLCAEGTVSEYTLWNVYEILVYILYTMGFVKLLFKPFN